MTASTSSAGMPSWRSPGRASAAALREGHGRRLLAQDPVAQVEELQQVEAERDVRRAVRPVPREQPAVGLGEVPLDPVAVPASEGELHRGVLTLDVVEVTGELGASGLECLRGCRARVGPVARCVDAVPLRRSVQHRDVEQRRNRRELRRAQPANVRWHWRGDQQREVFPLAVPHDLGYRDGIPPGSTRALERVGLRADHRVRDGVPTDLGEPDVATVRREELQHGSDEAGATLLGGGEDDARHPEHRREMVEQHRGARRAPPSGAARR